ncbi:outer membrane beta-barrel protein [Flavobacteriaceae bacterium R38]|nr:outer membrane beta-barrel protein [Flavobacteriaceae bacterium R38]
MRYLLCAFCLLLPLLGMSQNENDEDIDTRYLEDQFYVGVTYNVLLNRPSGVTQNNLPFGIQVGYIKDIPMNSRRNIGLGIGLGYNFNSYFNNLQAIEQGGDIVYQLIDDDTQFNRNKISTHVLELPIEFRWRTSKPDSYRFWRIYSGVRLGYVFANVSKFVSDTERIRFTNDDVERFQYDLYLSFGYNTWNFYASYALNNLLKDNTLTVDGERIDISTLKIGLIFYLL